MILEKPGRRGQKVIQAKPGRRGRRERLGQQVRKVHKAQRETPESLDRKARREIRELQVRRARRDRKALKAIQGPRDRRVKAVCLLRFQVFAIWRLIRMEICMFTIRMEERHPAFIMIRILEISTMTQMRKEEYYGKDITW